MKTFYVFLLNHNLNCEQPPVEIAGHITANFIGSGPRGRTPPYSGDRNLLPYIRLEPPLLGAGSSSHGFGGMVGPTSCTGAEISGRDFRPLFEKFDGVPALRL